MMRAPDHYETTLQSDSGWIDVNFTELPPLTLKHIHQYFITGRLCKECVTASKAFERGYRLFNSKKVQCLSSHGMTSTSVYIAIASFLQQCYPHKNQVHTKQPLQLTKQMGRLSMEAVPALQVIQPVITLLHWCLQLTTWTEHMLAKEVVGGPVQLHLIRYRASI